MSDGNQKEASPAELWADEVRETVAKETGDLIRARRRGEDAAILESSLRFADGNIKGIAMAVDREAARFNLPGIACGAGCAACCYVRVSVLPPEAFNIARYVNGRLTGQERQALLQRIREYIQTISSLPVEGRMRHVLACPFLGEDKRCTIYDARPLACRMHHSLSREACEDRNSPVPVIEDFVEATVPVMEGIFDGCRLADTVADELEFAPAVLVALEDPDAEARWLDGANVFTSAVDLYLREYVASQLAEGAPSHSAEVD